MKPPETPRPKGSLKKVPRTPARLGIEAARLFGNVTQDDGDPANNAPNATLLSSSNHFNQMYLDQCHGWFTRETRSGMTPKPEPLMFAALTETAGAGEEEPLRKTSLYSKPRMKSKRMTRCLALSSLTSSEPSPSASIEPPDASPPPGCVACSANKNTDVTSSNFFKLLANNVLICSAHRFITHLMMDFGKRKQDESAGGHADSIEPVWRPESEELQADWEVPFSVAEDRRLAAGVDRFGTDAWESILNDYHFAPNRTPEDLKKRWQQLGHTCVKAKLAVTAGGHCDKELGCKPVSKEVPVNRAMPFTITEDYRIIAGVDRFGTDDWDTILSQFRFSPSCTVDDLKKRWQQLNKD